MKGCTLLVILLFGILQINAQYQIGLVPRSSPDKAVYQKVGYTGIEIKYGSPAVNERQIWGSLVPYNKVWRAGANNATTIEFSTPVAINSTTLDSGRYALFIIPKDNSRWTVIFNKTSEQWGAFRYDSKEDAVRLEVSPRRRAFPCENLTYSIEQLGFQYGSIKLCWEYLELEIPFETNYLESFAKEVESRAHIQPEYIKWIVFIQGAEHLEQINMNAGLAAKWIDKAESLMNSTSEWNAQFYPREYVVGHLYWTKAKILAGNQMYSEAVNYIEKMKSLENLIYYERKKDTENIDMLLEEWNSK